MFANSEDLLGQCDAVVVCSENMLHAELIEAAAQAGKPVLCEKPLAPSREHADRIRHAVQTTEVMVMTAFPCPFSPVFQRLLQRVRAGDIGRVLAVNATNRGTCPFGWFTRAELSGGGAMIDHVVHVADLLWRLLGEAPETVVSQTGTNMYSQEFDDTAHLTLGYPSGVFATIDSSWSRPQNYRTWGDVTLKVLGEKGVIEADLFGQGVSELTDRYRNLGTASDLDGAMVGEFLKAVTTGRPPSVTAEDGLRASAVAIAGYESAYTGRASRVA